MFQAFNGFSTIRVIDSLVFLLIGTVVWSWWLFFCPVDATVYFKSCSGIQVHLQTYNMWNVYKRRRLLLSTIWVPPGCLYSQVRRQVPLLIFCNIWEVTLETYGSGRVTETFPFICYWYLKIFIGQNFIFRIKKKNNTMWSLDFIILEIYVSLKKITLPNNFHLIFWSIYNSSTQTI